MLISDWLLQGFNAVITLSQLIGTILLFYTPTYVQTLYESFSGHDAPPSVRWVSLLLIMCSPVSNGWVYGIKSKTIQMTFVHFARKQIYKSEVNDAKIFYKNVEKYILFRLIVRFSSGVQYQAPEDPVSAP